MEISKSALRRPSKLHSDEIIATSVTNVMHEPRGACGRLSIDMGSGLSVKVNYVLGTYVGRGDIKPNIMHIRTHNVPDRVIEERKDLAAALAEAAATIAASKGYVLESSIPWMARAISLLPDNPHQYREGAD